MLLVAKRKMKRRQENKNLLSPKLRNPRWGHKYQYTCCPFCYYARCGFFYQCGVTTWVSLILFFF